SILRPWTWGQPQLQLLAGAEQTRHDRAHRNPRHCGDLLVTQPLQLAEHDRLAELGEQLLQRPLEELQLPLADEQVLAVELLIGLAVEPLIERHHRQRAALLQPVVGDSANDREQPGPAIAASK